MVRRKETLVAVISAVLFTLLFHRQAVGLNLMIFESLIFAWLLLSGQVKLTGTFPVITSIGLGLTSAFSVLTNSSYSIFANGLALSVFTGMAIYPEAKSLVTSVGMAITNFFYSQLRFVSELAGREMVLKRTTAFFRRSGIFVLPLLIILFFIIIYRASNPVFDNLIRHILSFIDRYINLFLSRFDLSFIYTFITGLIISNFLLLRKTSQGITDWDSSSSDMLNRVRRAKTSAFRTNSLKNEYKAALFLLFFLNAILLILNIIDINWVWFNFEWEGQYLKQFVHEGTYLLILSILISIVIVLYYFRRNLNFYSRNAWLKYLSYTWLAQNGILAISVAIRNFWYIRYFALAYGRIGVILFLILTLYGLYTVVVKVRNRKSAFYLFSCNAYAFYIVLIISSLINWDSFIARYNFRHADRAFLHLDYLSTLSDKALPYLDKPLNELMRIDSVQKKKFPFEYKFISPQEYHQIIEKRKVRFIRKWESESFLSWNLPDYQAYKKLQRIQ
ncbi:MAG: DUF4173 domain-containing protein [Bacteroidetes bacterium]|nr:DUF4173 domain-containing protein [Bacteroidota bacterium]